MTKKYRYHYAERQMEKYLQAVLLTCQFSYIEFVEKEGAVYLWYYYSEDAISCFAMKLVYK
jgi:hypothetical protein